MSERSAQINRLAVSVLALTVIAVALAVVTVAWRDAPAGIERVRGLADFLERHDDHDGRIILTLAVTAIVLVMLSVLVLELTASPAPRMRLRNVTSGDVTITTVRIAQHIDDAVRALPHVAASATNVERHGKKVAIVLDLHVDAGADLAQTADEGCRTAHTLVERLGIELATMPRARLHYRELRLQAERPALRSAEVEGVPKGQEPT